MHFVTRAESTRRISQTVTIGDKVLLSNAEWRKDLFVLKEMHDIHFLPKTKI